MNEAKAIESMEMIWGGGYQCCLLDSYILLNDEVRVEAVK